MVHKYDTERAVGLLRQYQANLTSPEEQALKTSVGKVSAILGSQLFQALLGKKNKKKKKKKEKKKKGEEEEEEEACGWCWSGVGPIFKSVTR
ncbi:hypothetical protein INR49_014428 [Caranx melampygus]|nr:hypothetical protein INR49_014428 [Caranx melampygus]